MEADISILRKTGHFYFALTRIRYRAALHRDHGKHGPLANRI
jgi:hypothetical protein